jgi:DNA-binding MarR family transcriptional regulator
VSAHGATGICFPDGFSFSFVRLESRYLTSSGRIVMRYQTTQTVYRFIWVYWQAHGFPPTQQEIADACFISRSGVSRHLDRLTVWGWLQREAGKARSFRPLVDPDQASDPTPKKVAK